MPRWPAGYVPKRKVPMQVLLDEETLRWLADLRQRTQVSTNERIRDAVALLRKSLEEATP